MNYQHIFHSGNFADVFKHSILTLLLQYITAKDKPCVFIDTHSGIGLYDLKHEKAQRTQEAMNGIYKLLANEPCIPELTPYLTLVKKYLSAQPALYPGSPIFLSEYLRSEDRLILNELREEDFDELKINMGKDNHIHLHHRDAYEFLPAILPPKPSRGLILIDPPFEKTDEYRKLTLLIQQSLKRFAHGIYMLWYPIVDLSDVKAIQSLMQQIKIPTLRAQINIDEITEDRKGLIGCGVLIINPPWKIDQPVEKISNYLCKLFAVSGDAAVLLS